MAPPDEDDKTVKDLIDAATRAELEKWFGLPSFQQVAEDAPAPVEDPEVAAVRERRQKAIDAVDPGLLEAHRRRMEDPETLIKFQALIDVRVDPSVLQFDLGMLDRQISIGEPREVEISDALRDDLAECAPQALLRDLHRPELDFEKTFEVIDYAAEQRVDAVAIVNEMMSTCWALAAQVSPFHEGAQLLRELRISRLQSWAHALPSLPNRRVTE